MKKLIAILAITGLLVACNDNSGRTERSAADTTTAPVVPADTAVVTPDTTATTADTTAKPAAH